MPKKLSLFGLVAIIYFAVSGGPYGLEDLIAQTGYGLAVVILCLVPILWSLPTALMVGELSSSIPDCGGFYIWVQRALGNFWGFQEAWLSLTASIFDMAIYPTLFVSYLGFLSPSLTAGWHGIAIGVALIAACFFWNLKGAHAVGSGSTLLGAVMISPFIALIVTGLWRSGVAVPVAHPHPDLMGGVMIAMWNFMGWDNASTVANEVENPQKNYPRAMLLTMLLIVASYVLPILAVWHLHIPLSSWTTGSWAAVGGLIGGWLLRDAIILGGLISSAGMLNSLMLSYSRLPVALADDGYLPSIFTKLNKNDVPWVALIGCSIAWALALGLNFEKLVMLDILLYGSSLILEFIALAVLRWKEPDLVRPFRVPGGKIGVVMLGVLPTILLGFSAAHNAHDGLRLGIAIFAMGVVVWLVKNNWTSRIRPSYYTEHTD